MVLVSKKMCFSFRLFCFRFEEVASPANSGFYIGKDMLNCKKRIDFTIIVMSLATVLALTGTAKAWCVLNDSVLPLAIFGEPAGRTTKEQIENLKAEIKCREQKKNETMQDDFYRYNFFGLDND